jgi:predicted signal transduction protein with EAL and GGDEF domain
MWVHSEKIEGVRLAQFQSFATKMPAYYVTLAAMMAVTAYSFHGKASRWLALDIPIDTPTELQNLVVSYMILRQI